MKILKPKLLDKVENGKRVSPILPPDIKNYLIDVDGTICEDIPNEEPERMITAAVLPNTMKKINEWYDHGHIITFFTSRTEEHRAITEKWLQDKGFKYHKLLVGKPRGGNYYWIDNAAINVLDLNTVWVI